MTKRGTTLPLVIWVAGEWRDHPMIADLRTKGHQIYDMTVALGNAQEPDLILHPAAHLWNDMMWDYLPAALAAARKRKREAK